MLAEPVRHRFTVKDYHLMGESEVFAPDQRLELLGGEIFEMAAIGRRHAATVNRLTRIFVLALGDRAVVGVQNPVWLGDISEPQPDFAVLRPRPDFYESGHPRPDDVLLLIEVSDTTAAWDRSVKRPFYAAAGIAEMWIVDLGLRVVEVATDPGPDNYRNIEQLRPGSTLVPVSIPGMALEVADLFS